MKIYVVCSNHMDMGEPTFDVFKTKSKANKRVKEIKNNIENEEFFYANIMEYDFPPNRTGLINAMINGIALGNDDAIGEVEE